MHISRSRDSVATGAWASQLVRDAALIGFITLLSTLLYVGRIGFYTDDWFSIGVLLQQSPDKSYPGLLWTFTDSNTLPRPVLLVYVTTLYYFFGTHPLGYHIFNTLNLVALSVIFHIVARELRFPRRFALALSLTFILLPHASAARFWPGLFQANLSLFFFCLSLYADLRLLRDRPGSRLGWQLLSAASLLLSTLAYELTIPLFALVPLLLWFQRRQLAAGDEASAGPRTPLVVLARNWLLLIVVLAFKIFTTNRIEEDFNPIGQIGWFLNLQVDAFKMLLLGPYGARLPKMWQHILFQHFDPSVLALSLAAGALIFWLLARPGEDAGDRLPSMRNLLLLLGVAIFCIVAGYGIFLTNRQALITATGINNRSSVGALFGIALLVVAGAGILARLLRNEGRARLAFALLITAYSTSSFLAVGTLGDMWAAASQEQQQIMAEVSARFPALAPDSVLILDGFCPNVGPGVVFEARWDTTGMLRSLYNNATLEGDVVTPFLEVREDAIYTRMYQKHEVRTPETEAAAQRGQLRRLALVPYFIHPYGRMWIYNRKYDLVVPIPDAAAARAYFAQYNPGQDSGCTFYRAGNGESVW